ncbi:MAG: hypothetical protein WDN24_00880 [Sphingomonas sp.]
MTCFMLASQIAAARTIRVTTENAEAKQIESQFAGPGNGRAVPQGL